MNDIFLEFDDVEMGFDIRKRLCVRKNFIASAWRNGDTGNADMIVLGDPNLYHTTIPYEEFIKQFMVIKMEGK